jgi:hypothetical protein
VDEREAVAGFQNDEFRTSSRSDTVPPFVLRPSSFVLRPSALLIQRLVEIEQLARHHRERGELRRGQGGVGLAVADGEEGFRALRVRRELLLEIAGGLNDDFGLRSGQRAQQDARAISAIAAEGSLLSFSTASASRRAASTNCGSFSVTSAWSGVFVRSRRTVQTSRVGALKTSMLGEGAWRFQRL